MLTFIWVQRTAMMTTGVVAVAADIDAGRRKAIEALMNGGDTFEDARERTAGDPTILDGIATSTSTLVIDQ